MIHGAWYWMLLFALFVLGPLVFAILLVVPAPYGRHAERRFGPEMNTRMAWVIMELPAVALFAFVFFEGQRALEVVPLVFFGLWQVHYVQRALVYPFLLRPRRRTAVVICALGFAFNCANATLNGAWISSDLAGYTTGWLTDPRFLIGLALFVGGYGINRWADRVLRNLRKPGDGGYAIPRGGLYEWVSSPNYLGEMIEWCGWAVMTWSPPGLAFAVFTVANLLPRAIAHHRWYRETFPDYPERRKAAIPYLL